MRFAQSAPATLPPNQLWRILAAAPLPSLGLQRRRARRHCPTTKAATACHSPGIVAPIHLLREAPTLASLNPALCQNQLQRNALVVPGSSFPCNPAGFVPQLGGRSASPVPLFCDTSSGVRVSTARVRGPRPTCGQGYLCSCWVDAAPIASVGLPWKLMRVHSTTSLHHSVARTLLSRSVVLCRGAARSTRPLMSRSDDNLQAQNSLTGQNSHR